MAAEGRESRLGWFVPLAAAWGRADEDTRALLSHAVQAYAAGIITGQTLEQRFSQLLGIPAPA